MSASVPTYVKKGDLAYFSSLNMTAMNVFLLCLSTGTCVSLVQHQNLIFRTILSARILFWFPSLV